MSSIGDLVRNSFCLVGRRADDRSFCLICCRLLQGTSRLTPLSSSLRVLSLMSSCLGQCGNNHIAAVCESPKLCYNCRAADVGISFPLRRSWRSCSCSSCLDTFDPCACRTSTSPASALTPGRPRPSSATLARVSVTSALAVPASLLGEVPSAVEPATVRLPVLRVFPRRLS